jgi:alkylation response protein AidB-like acyl-CoA dehydrogenase
MSELKKWAREHMRGLENITDPRIGPRTYARKEGKEYVIVGTKAGFLTNADIAQYYFVIARTDLNKPQQVSTAFFFVPAGTPGLVVGRPCELLGWKTAHAAEVVLEDLRVGEEALVGGPAGEGGANFLFLMQAMPYIGIGLAAVYVGLARAAYEYALEYAQHRVSWGQPIIRHQSITAMLADMVVETQAARLVVWDAAWHVDQKSEMAPVVKSPAAKTFAVDVAIRNAERAVKILGAYGVCQEYRTTKYLCDAWVGWPCDGPNTMLRLHMANLLFGLYGPPPGVGPGGGPPPGLGEVGE